MLLFTIKSSFMKILSFIYEESEIHFAVNPGDRNVMINATEMAKVFDKSVKIFLKKDHTKAFIETLKRGPYGLLLGPLEDHEIIDFRGRNGMFFCRPLALKFAGWLDPAFEVWVYTTLDDVVFGNYRLHWEAHARQEQAKKQMEQLKREMLISPTAENVRAYFEAERTIQQAKKDKTKAIRQQLNLFDDDE